MVRAGPVATLGLLLLLGVAGPAAAAANSFNVIVLVPEGPHEIGSMLSARVLVFDFGTPRDADSLTILVNPSARVREIDWTRTSTGVYVADVRLQASDADAFGNVVLVATARLGGLEDSGYGFAILDTFVTVDVALSRSVVAPGESLTAEVTVRSSGTLTDADFLAVVASLGLGDGSEVNHVSYDRVGVGTYVATYTVRPSLRQDSLLEISAVATIGSTRSFGSGFVNVEWSDAFEIWYHPLAITEREAMLELWVVGPNARPVPGVLVSITYLYFNAQAYQVEVRVSHATTDAVGAARFVLDPVGLTYPIVIEGSARLGGTSQSFSGEVRPILAVPPPGFWAFRRDPLSPLGELGDMVTHSYRAYLNQVPYVDGTIQYFAHTDSDLIASGEVVANSDGHFTLRLPAQSTVTYVAFLTQFDGSWFEYTDILLPTVRLEATYDEVFIGSRTTITATRPGDIPLLAVASISLLDLAAPPWQRFDPSWSRWSGVFSEFTFATVEGSILSAVVVTPPFLPKDRDYLLAILAYPTAYSAPPPVYMNYWVIRIENVPPTAVARVSNRYLLEGTSLALNASSSLDRDGTVIGYAVDWGDGTATDWSTSPAFEHTYATPGSFGITLLVRDDSGAIAETVLLVEVHSRLPQAILNALPVLLPIVAAAAIAAAVLWRVLPRRRSPTSTEFRISPPDDPSETADPPAEPETRP